MSNPSSHKYLLKQNFKSKSIILDPIDSSSRKHKKKIAILLGGMSCEREVSMKSGTSAASALIQNGYEVVQIDPGADIALILADIKPDVVFNALHGRYGEDGCIQGLLNIMRIPYTHSGVFASSVGMNKFYTRQILSSVKQISFADAIVVDKKNYQDEPMQRPYVIKPLQEGSSIGVEVVYVEDDFKFKNYDFAYGSKVLIEKYIKGREINVAVLNGKALGLMEIQILKGRFYDYTAKYSQGYTKHVEPINLPESQKQKVLLASEEIYQALNCNGIIRVEFIYAQEEQKFYFLEVNTHPGMTNLSLCPEIAIQQGIGFNDLVEQILFSAKYD